MAPGAPRITPLTYEELDESCRELLLGMIHNDKGTIRARTPDDPVPSFIGTMLRHPRLFRKWAPFGGALLVRGTIPVRDRELVCLRVAWLCQASMEWSEHVKIAHAEGFTTEDTERVTAGPDAPGWNDWERTVVRAVDELHATGTITDATWSGLTQRYDQQQLIELPTLVGNYTTTAYVQNALRVEFDADMGGLAAR